MNVKIDRAFLDKVSGIRLGVLEAEVKVEASNEALKQDMLAFLNEMRSNLPTADISKQENIMASRKAYRVLGKDPTRYRVSSEKLLRRVTKGEGIDWINNVVDLSNWVSVKSMNSVGTYDLGLLEGELTFTYGSEGEQYLNIGNQEMNLESLPIFKDIKGAFGSTTADSKGTAVTETTQHMILNIISFNESEVLEEHLHFAKQLFETYATVSGMKMGIVSSKGYREIL